MQEKNEHYNEVLKLCEKDFSHDEIIKFLKEGNLLERQYAALNLNCVKSKSEANILMSNFVGIDGKIREAAALKIAELTKNTPELFYDKANYKIFVNATIDIDGNVCRMAINSAINLKQNDDFCKYYAEHTLKLIEEALNEISKFTFKDKKYKINKQIFKIYWCLEALTEFYIYANQNLFMEILRKCSNLSEYTVREKCAKILYKMPKNSDLTPLITKLKNDENYYVRNIFE